MRRKVEKVKEDLHIIMSLPSPPLPIVLKVISLIKDFLGKQMHETKYGCRKSPVECSWDKTLLKERNRMDGVERGVAM